jgi:hypothetical protein
VQDPGLSRIALVLCRVKHVLRLPFPLDTQNNPVTLLYDPSASSSHHCSTWRWVFYLNLPIPGVCLVMLYFFLQVNNPERDIGLRTKLARIDWVGNFFLISSVSGILIGLSWGGSTYAWSSWNVLVSLCTGLQVWHFSPFTKGRLSASSRSCLIESLSAILLQRLL